MSSEQAAASELVLDVENLGKTYLIYDRPFDRLKQILTGGRRRYYNEFTAL